MKTLSKILSLVFILLLAGCGATEVGNPVGTIVFSGQIDVPDEDDSLSKNIFKAFESYDVTATDEEGTDYSTDVDTEGFFSIEVPIEHTYIFAVLRDGTPVGEISFESDDDGNRSNELRIEAPDRDEFDFGRVLFQGGEFKPEIEPRREMEGVNEMNGREERQNSN